MVSAARTPDENQTFLDVCVAQKFLDTTAAESLRTAIRSSGHVSQEAIRRGLLTPADVDIVEALLRPTTTIPGYEILQVVGRGGMGVVYQARQLDLGRVVALKTILLSNADHSIVAARFEREARSLAQLQHPNIIQALNFGEHEGRYFFAMEYAAGQTCEQAVANRSGMTPARVWSIVRQVASGLMHALGHNLIHRDIKPANLILVPPPEGTTGTDLIEIVKIADFGLAMFADDAPDDMKLTTGDKIMGSPAYMSPEQFSGGDVDFRTDVYALGATAWHLLFGTTPFDGGSIGKLFKEKMQRLSVDRSSLPITVSDDQWQLLHELLEPNPIDRPASYGSLIEKIDNLQIREGDSASWQRATLLPTETVSFAGSTRGASTAETIELSGPPARIRRPSRRQIIIGAGIAAITIPTIRLFQSEGTPRGPRDFKQVARAESLYDGVTLTGWDVDGSMVGAWNTVEAPDASTAIACTTGDGALTRRFQESPHPRISLFVWQQPDSGPIDIDFAFEPGTPGDLRGCLRMTGHTNQIGIKETDFGELKSANSKEAMPSAHERYHVVHIERQQSDWYVFIEEQLIGTLPIREVGSGNALRLVVHKSPHSESQPPFAFFADVQHFDLQRDPSRSPIPAPMVIRP